VSVTNGSERADLRRRDIRPAGTISRPAAVPRVAVFANSPALKAGLTSLLNDDERVHVLSDDNLASGDSPDVIIIESTADELIEDLIDNQWPRSALLFVGEPPAEALTGGDRLVGAVSSGIDAIRLSAAVQALAAGLTVVDPELSVSLPLHAHSDDAIDQPDILTPRERQVLELVARGYPNKSIAYELGISEHTAKFHVGSLLTKLEAASRTEVVTNATRRGLLTV
jgi:two-component system, NarL family, nitrate/nitrite response regulator NarL